MKVARFMEDIKERKLRFSYLAILFVLISFLGWCGETVYFVLRWDDFTDRGFLSLPLCTIYGCSILAIYLIIGTPTRGRLKPLFIRAKSDACCVCLHMRDCIFLFLSQPCPHTHGGGICYGAVFR